MLGWKLDDVVLAVPMHLGCGVVATLFVELQGRSMWRCACVGG